MKVYFILFVSLLTFILISYPFCSKDNDISIGSTSSNGGSEDKFEINKADMFTSVEKYLVDYYTKINLGNIKQVDEHKRWMGCDFDLFRITLDNYDPKNSLIRNYKVYSWTYCTTYIKKNQEDIILSSGFSMPMYFSLEYSSSWNVKAIEQPGDGNLYEPSVKRIFPPAVQTQIFEWDKTQKPKEFRTHLKKRAEQFFNSELIK